MAFYIQQTNLECEGKTRVLKRDFETIPFLKIKSGGFEWVDNKPVATYVFQVSLTPAFEAADYFDY